MADVADDTPFKDAATAISQGKRHLLVRDYNMAVTVLAQACELLVKEHGDTADELGELYLLYGRALLGLAREEAGVLGGGVPGSEETGQDEDDEDEEEEDDTEEKDEADKEDETNTKAESEKKNEDTTETKEKSESPKAEVNKQESVKEKVEELKDTVEKDEKAEESNKTDNSKVEEKKVQEQEQTAGCSRDYVLANGESSSSTKKEDNLEDVEKDGDDDDVNNLQIAWEILELAKLILLKRGPPGWKLLAESYRLLGEVAMEGGNHQGALTDLEGCMNLLQKVTPRDDRAIAEIHYQLGLAHSLANDFDASIEQFNMATLLLETRINDLQKLKDPPESDDPFYTVQGEIQELKDLLPEIQEKIADIKDFKKEACRIKEIKDKVIGSCSNGAGPSDASVSTATPKPASDISHLIKKKRKAEDEQAENASPCKKPTPEKDT